VQAVPNVTRTGLSGETHAIKSNLCGVWNSLKERRALNHSAQKECFDTGDIVLVVDALYVPRDKEFCVKRTYRFCVVAQCFSKLPRFSNLTPVTNAVVGRGATQQDVESALSMGLTIE